MGMARARIIVEGRVQGVFFRATMKEVADSLGLRGWVRNLPDGRRVEAMVEGDLEDIKRLVCWCMEGPPMARVERVSVELGEYRGEFKEFKIVY